MLGEVLCKMLLNFFFEITLFYARQKGDINIELLSLVATTPTFAEMAKPTDSLAAIQSTAVTLSPEEMAEVRGEGFLKIFRKGVYGWSETGWEIGRRISISQNGFDPGGYPGFRCAVFGKSC